MTRLLLLIADLCDRVSGWCLRRANRAPSVGYALYDGAIYSIEGMPGAERWRKLGDSPQCDCDVYAFDVERTDLYVSRTPLPTPPPDDIEGGLQSRTGGEKP